MNHLLRCRRRFPVLSIRVQMKFIHKINFRKKYAKYAAILQTSNFVLVKMSSPDSKTLTMNFASTPPRLLSAYV